MSRLVAACIEEDPSMAMNPKPPTPDALLTIKEQLLQLGHSWQDAINQASNSSFAQGQVDAWHQAQSQIASLIESITVARASGIYLTDAQRQLVRLIEDRHQTTMTFLRTLHRRICAAVLAPVEVADEDDQAG